MILINEANTTNGPAVVPAPLRRHAAYGGRTSRHPVMSNRTIPPGGAVETRGVVRVLGGHQHLGQPEGE